MADADVTTAARRPRADAERNRARLLEAAKAAFADKGAAASLDEIARAAGVGIGTLYRRFPTRDALVEAVFRKESDQLFAAAARLAATRPPVAALREWLLLFLDYLAVKRGMAEALSAIAAGAPDLKAASGAKLNDGVTLLVERAVASGCIRLDIEPMDLLRALAAPASTEAARRLVDILVAGMRTGRPEAAQAP
ncbi:TetR family transcriptional regulator [Roseiarcus fermentans]|uniref:TetR family transcriptional regulator n=1 Tax=Roseiarcus fermentans TaxID=1473586 RepID=A0A366F5Z3_9HYPH|nr:TetR family transcriptional regulator [Roseiarcus fermentans]